MGCQISISLPGTALEEREREGEREDIPAILSLCLFPKSSQQQLISPNLVRVWRPAQHHHLLPRPLAEPVFSLSKGSLGHQHHPQNAKREALSQDGKGVHET